MDLIFIEGIGVTVSSIIVFVGSIFLLLAMVTGAKLSYYVTASVTLAFMVMMGVVWSLNPLGPVGELPEWTSGRIGETPDAIDFGPATQFPGTPWEPPDRDDETIAGIASDLENQAVEVAEARFEKTAFGGFESADEITANTDKTRFLEQEGQRFGMVQFDPAEGIDARGSLFVLMRYDPGNPLGQARMITAGTFVVLVLHLIGLSASERRAARREQEGS